MKLDYSVEKIADWTKGKTIGPSNHLISQIFIDSRSPLINSNSAFITLKGHKTNGKKFIKNFIDKGGQIIITDEEIDVNSSITQIIVKNPLNALQSIAKNHRLRFNIPIIGITGSNGKTIVKEWLYHVLKTKFNIVRSPKSYNSQIGVALSLLEINLDNDIGLFEAGISLPGEMESLKEMIQPTIGIFTGIGDAHQENFENLNQKEIEKYILFQNTKTIIKYNDNLADKLSFISNNNLSDEINSNIVYQAAIKLGMDEHSVLKALADLPSISMRMEKIEGINRNVLINDTYTFDIKSLEIGLQHLQLNSGSLKKIVFLYPEVIEYSNNLIDLLNQSRIDRLIIIGNQNIINDYKGESDFFNTVDEFTKNPIDFEDSMILFSGSRKNALERIIPIYQEKKHITSLEINLSAIRENLNFYRNNLKPKTKILAMVKAQSYGGGIVEMAKFLALEGVKYLGVAYADEGVLLRKNGVELPIIVMNPEKGAFDDLIDYQLEPSIYSISILNDFIHQLIIKSKTRFPIHIKLDTGMNRLGFKEDDILELVKTLNVQPEVYVKSVFSHLAVADDIEEANFTNFQIDLYAKMSNDISDKLNYTFIKHIANSSGALNFKSANFDMVRIGIGLFGLINPNLKSALKFVSQISQTKSIKKGDSVGYSRRFIAKTDTNIGIIPVGYADGLSRGLSCGKWSVKINENYFPIIGSICMDMCMVDIGSYPISEGDTVEIFGWENSINQMAKELDTISYEIISSISSRVKRVYID